MSRPGSSVAHTGTGINRSNRLHIPSLPDLDGYEDALNVSPRRLRSHNAHKPSPKTQASKRSRIGEEELDDRSRQVDIKRTKFTNTRKKAPPPSTFGSLDYPSSATSLPVRQFKPTKTRSQYGGIETHRLTGQSLETSNSNSDQKTPLFIPDDVPSSPVKPKPAREKACLQVPEDIDFADLPIKVATRPATRPARTLVNPPSITSSFEFGKEHDNAEATRTCISEIPVLQTFDDDILDLPQKDGPVVRNPRGKFARTFSSREREQQARQEKRRLEKEAAQASSSQEVPIKEHTPVLSSPIRLQFADDEFLDEFRPVVASTQVINWKKQLDKHRTSPTNEGSLEKILKSAINGEIVCTTCKRRVAASRLEQFANGNYLSARRLVDFCEVHKHEDALKAWEDLGLPEIQWDGLKDRVAKLQSCLQDVLLEKKPSEFRTRLADAIHAGRNRNINIVRSTLGYYGIRGMLAIQSAIYTIMGKTIQARALKDKTVSGRGWMFFTENVLVPEAIIQLIMEDKDVEEEEALELLKSTTWIGDALSQDVQETLPMDISGMARDDEDDSDASSVADPIEDAQRSSPPPRLGSFDYDPFASGGHDDDDNDDDE